jgi:asparagine synthase (glutamine-hydrolysing)
MLGSELFTITVDHAGIVGAYPELVQAAEGPVLDTSCAALLRLAQSVHEGGYKVVLTGEGADEALAGYFWYKLQSYGDAVSRRTGQGISKFIGRLGKRSVTGFRSSSLPERLIGGARPVQFALYDMISLLKPALYSAAMKEMLGDHDPYSDLDVRNDRVKLWHPLNQSIYAGYKIMLPGMLLLSKGDRIAMNASVETRYPYLDEEVIAFCAGIAPEYKLRGTVEKWILRQVAGRILPKRIAKRPKTMFRANMSGTFLGLHRPRWVDQLLSRESLYASGYFDPEVIARQRWWQTHIPRITPARGVYDVALSCVVSTHLWHHIFCGGGLCELPTWQASARRHALRPRSLPPHSRPSLIP